jgi:4-amino-4-deoxy-L-arabinose transferase-like glycosyltransferase
MGSVAGRWGDVVRQFMVHRAAYRALRGATLSLACCVVLVVLAGVCVAYWLVRFPFDGLYGQDSYAYYYQSLEIWRQIRGAPPPAWPFVGEGLYHWPVGYHLHVMAGFVAGESPDGGRAITLLMAALVPALLCMLVWLLPGSDTGAGSGGRTLAGLIAGLALLTTGVYARASLALMSDVPALFWALLGLYCWLRAWPPAAADEGEDERAAGGQWRSWWGAVAGLVAGVALGMAVLVRYSSVLFLAPAVVYTGLSLALRKGRRLPLPAVLWAAGGFVVALLPQAAYALTHPGQAGGLTLLEDWDVNHFLASTPARAADGTVSYAHPMAEFYLLDPVRDTAVGFLSLWCLPAVACGLYALLRRRQWLTLCFLMSWWLVPASFFSGTAYQAHRFVLVYMPAITVLVGIGSAHLAGSIWLLFRKGLTAQTAVGCTLALLMLVATTGGLVYDVRAATASVRAQATAKEDELRLVALARRAAAQPGELSSARDRAPHADIVCFGMSAMLYHYTGWHVLDLYNHDEMETGRFLAGDGAHVVVVPVEQMHTRWRGTPSGRRWEWLRGNYHLLAVGRVGDYTVFRVIPGPTPRYPP